MEGRKINRVSRACDTCRRRKIKCDGESPCAHCVDSGDCTYTYAAKRKPRPKEDNYEDLKARMGRLESLIKMMASNQDLKVSPQEVNRAISPEMSQETNLRENSDSDSPEMEGNNPYTVKFVKCGGGEGNEVHEHYFGNHSSFSIFSPQGIKWIASKLKDKNAALPLKYLDRELMSFPMDSVMKWVEPVETNDLSPFPSKNNCLKLVDFFFKSPSPLFLSFEKHQVVKIFHIYFHERSRSNESSFKSCLSYSDYMVMNVVILISLLFYSDDENHDQSLSEKEVGLLEENHLKNCIYYYHRICVVGDGIRAISAILLLSIYLESKFLSAPSDMLLSTAIRMGQELGLHRKESYIALPEEIVKKRSRVWWMCYTLDKDKSLRSGKPPLINDCDTTAPFPKHSQSDTSSDHGHEYQYAVIISHAYNALFSATALEGKKTEQVIDIINDINVELENWRKSIPSNLRPVMDFTPPPEPVNYAITCSSLTLHLHYHFLRMLTNRMIHKLPWQPGKDTTECSTENPVANCLFSARQILKSCIWIDKRLGNLMNWFVYVPSTAFITIFCSLMQEPTRENAVEDLHLLVRFFAGFFLKTHSNSPPKWAVIQKTFSYITYVVIVRLQETRGINFPSGDLFDSVVERMECLKMGPLSVSPTCNAHTASQLVPPPLQRTGLSVDGSSISEASPTGSFLQDPLEDGWYQNMVSLPNLFLGDEFSQYGFMT